MKILDSVQLDEVTPNQFTTWNPIPKAEKNGCWSKTQNLVLNQQIITETSGDQKTQMDALKPKSEPVLTLRGFM